MFEELKNGIRIFVGRVVLELLIKTVFGMFRSIAENLLGLLNA